MNDKLLFGLIVLALFAGFSFYWAVNSSDSPNTPIPSFQYEAMTAGLAVQNPWNVSLGIDAQVPLPKQQVHFWIPGLDPSPGATPSKQYTPHRYPAVPGGNISTVMHHGLVESCCNRAPADSDWRLNPPEVAVL
jgi:hypothetical protein